MGQEEVTILSDEDSYGPTPPPPSHPHPDDVLGKQAKKSRRSKSKRGGGEEVISAPHSSSNNDVEIQGMENVSKNMKDDPPVENVHMKTNKKGDNKNLMDDTIDNEDMSVEIPPTTVVQKMTAREEQQPEKTRDNGKWTMIFFTVGCLLVILAITLGVGYGTGAFTSSESEAPPPEDDSSSSGGGDAGRPAAMSSYLESVAVRGADAFVNETSPESMAKNWLINDDPLQLDPLSEQPRIDQRFDLLTFWFSSPAYWKEYTGWAEAEDECTWFGVTCNPDNGAVTEISMDNNGVQALSLDLFTLSNLQVLSLAGNVITGELPETLQSAPALVELYLEANLFEQDLSDFDWSTLVNLEVLRLGLNGFRGTINDSLWTLTNLQELVLDSCAFTGEILPDAANLQNLVTFDINNNKNGDSNPGFSGTLPTFFASMPNLEVLALGGNSFEGSIPDEYGTFAVLKELNIAANLLTGDLETIGDLDSLTILRIGGNPFPGSIPAFLYDMTSLEVLEINGCEFDGQVDPAITNLVNLVQLNVADNFLTGTPAEFASLVNLESLNTQNNFFSGSLDFATSLTALVDLNVAQNQFTGEIPDLSGMTNLQFLRAFETPFGSAFPESITQLASLAVVDLSLTGLTGSIPAAIGSMTAMGELKLGGNSLTGPIPAEIIALSNLEVLELQKNMLTGDLPLDIGGLYNMRTFRIDENINPNNGVGGISGPLPNSIANMLFLEVLEVFNNLMTGTLPPEMGAMRRLRYLDVELNAFTGAVPAEFGGMESLQEFYLSSTQLTGAVPEDICQIDSLTYLVADCDMDCSCCSSCNN